MKVQFTLYSKASTKGVHNRAFLIQNPILSSSELFFRGYMTPKCQYKAISVFTATLSYLLSYFLCCEDVIEAADDQKVDRSSEGESTETDSESKVSRIWSIGRWVQTYPDPNTEDTIDW